MSFFDVQTIHDVENVI